MRQHAICFCLLMFATLYGCTKVPVQPQATSISLKVRATGLNSPTTYPASRYLDVKLERASASPAEKGRTVSSVRITHAAVMLSDLYFIPAGGDSTAAVARFAGPYIIDLTRGMQTIGTLEIPPGTYEAVRFHLHDLDDPEAVNDPNYQDAYRDHSVFVQGYVNGDPDSSFIFTDDVTEHVHLKGSFTFEEGRDTPYLIVFDTALWFLDRHGTSTYRDPRDPANHSEIENQIKDAIDGGEDLNRDGWVDVL